MVSENEEIRQQQLSMSAEDVFATENKGIPFHHVKSTLLELINKMEERK